MQLHSYVPYHMGDYIILKSWLLYYRWSMLIKIIKGGEKCVDFRENV